MQIFSRLCLVNDKTFSGRDVALSLSMCIIRSQLKHMDTYVGHTAVYRTCTMIAGVDKEETLVKNDNNSSIKQHVGRLIDQI